MARPEPETEPNYRIIRLEFIRFGRIESNRIDFFESRSNRIEPVLDFKKVGRIEPN